MCTATQHVDTFTAVHNDDRGSTIRGKPVALVIEDIRMACAILRLHGYQCDRLSHNELMMSVGSIHTGCLTECKYRLLWISTPADWYVRLPHKRAGPHWQKLQNLMFKAKELKMDIIVFGPPGYISGNFIKYETLSNICSSILRE